jgi:hypothetical protein
MTKQSTLFNETEPTVLAELDLEEAGKLAEALKVTKGFAGKVIAPT